MKIEKQGVLKGRVMPLYLSFWIQQKDLRKFLYLYCENECDYKVVEFIHTNIISKLPRPAWVATCGYLNLLKSMYSNRFYEEGAWSKWICIGAARFGYLDILKWGLPDKKFPWDFSAYWWASRHGHHDICKWFREDANICNFSHYIFEDSETDKFHYKINERGASPL